MKDNPLQEDWGHIKQFLPDNIDELAKASGAVKRWRNIKNAEELLRLNLAYVVEDLSLRSTAGWSAQSNMAEMKDTSVLHRLKKSVPFLEQLLAYLLNHRLHGEPAEGPAFRIKDATVLSIPGSTGTDWRIHATYDPCPGRLVRVEVTDFSGGESLARDRYQAGEVVIGDRGLAHAAGLHAVAEDGAYSLLRMNWQNIRLVDAQGRVVDWEAILRRADVGDTGTYTFVPLKGKSPLPARLIVRPLPVARAEEARRRLRRNASKKGRTPSAQVLRLAGYFCLLTTLPEKLASNDLLLELYRLRWQIELFFKRDKSLLHLNRLRADDPLLVRAYILAKLIEVALISLLATEGESFSPWGAPRLRRSAAFTLAAGAVEAH
jgi:hypothetical protein